MTYRRIIWDWNGTLLDDAGHCIAVMNRLLEARDLPRLTPERYAEIFGFPVIDYYRQLGFDFGREPFETISTAFITAYEAGRGGCPLREGTEALLVELDHRGYAQVLLSASKQAHLEEAVQAAGLAGVFRSLYGVDDHHAHGKTAVGRRLLEERDIDPHCMLMVGDTLHDAEVAADLGVDCVLIPSGHQSYSRLNEAGVPVFSDLDALDRLLM